MEGAALHDDNPLTVMEQPELLFKCEGFWMNNPDATVSQPVFKGSFSGNRTAEAALTNCGGVASPREQNYF